MESLSRLVTESLVRHGFDRPIDYRRLHWSRWFRCESHHSLLSVPSKPGVFAIAEEVMDFGTPEVETSAVLPTKRVEGEPQTDPRNGNFAEAQNRAAVRRILAVTQFFVDDDMAFVLDRMLSRHNPMRARLESGRYFVRYVVIDDQAQRRSICNALNQWMVSSAEKASGIGSHFASSLELPLNEMNVARENVAADRVEPSPAFADAVTNPKAAGISQTISKLKVVTQQNSGAASNVQCPPAFPAGF